MAFGKGRCGSAWEPVLLCRLQFKTGNELLQSGMEEVLQDVLEEKEGQSE